MRNGLASLINVSDGCVPCVTAPSNCTPVERTPGTGYEQSFDPRRSLARRPERLHTSPSTPNPPRSRRRHLPATDPGHATIRVSGLSARGGRRPSGGPETLDLVAGTRSEETLESSPGIGCPESASESGAGWGIRRNGWIGDIRCGGSAAFPRAWWPPQSSTRPCESPSSLRSRALSSLKRRSDLEHTLADQCQHAGSAQHQSDQATGYPG